jgi:xanthine dehydrogenase accessory factor
VSGVTAVAGGMTGRGRPGSVTGADNTERLQTIRDLALELRLWLSRGTSVAIATVLGAHGGISRGPGTVVAVSESGDTIGARPGGPLDGAIEDLAADVLSEGTARIEHFEIDEDAAAYIGLAGPVTVDAQAARIGAGDPEFTSMLRFLDSGSATVVAIGTRGASGYAVIGRDRSLGRLGWPQLPEPVVEDARRMLNTRYTTCRTYGPQGERDGSETEVWMQSFPAA